MHNQQHNDSLTCSLRRIATTASIALAGMLATGCANTSESKAPPAQKEAQTPAAPHTAEISQQASAKATVLAVNRESRSLTLKNAAGKTLSFVAAPEVKNFDQIHAGDAVNVHYKESVAVTLLKPDATTKPASATLAAGTAEPGQKPAVAVAGQVTATVKIESVDLKNNIVVFTGPQGEMEAVHVVRPEGKKFIQGIKQGDQVEITYTVAMAMSVDKQ
jgi:hypothetical protein